METFRRLVYKLNQSGFYQKIVAPTAKFCSDLVYSIVAKLRGK